MRKDDEGKGFVSEISLRAASPKDGSTCYISSSHSLLSFIHSPFITSGE